MIYRPLAFLFVKITYPLDFLTPNLVSTMAMCVGVTAGVMFGIGAPQNLVIGAILYFTCNVLDCADGQIARLKQNGTKVGRAIDGFIDYTVSIAVFVGIGIGMGHEYGHNTLQLWGTGIIKINPYMYIWIITILAALSSAAQAIIFDFYRNKYLEIVYGKFSPLEDQVAEFTEEKKRLEEHPEDAGVMDNILITLYIFYCNVQLKLQKEKSEDSKAIIPNPKVYYMQNKLLLRLWSFMGSTTHISMCVIFALLGNIEVFLLICILPLNLLLAVLYLAQSKVNLKLKKI